MNSYSHINERERRIISKMLALNKPKKDIAKQLDRNISTINREIRRNSRPIKNETGEVVGFKYSAADAHEHYLSRMNNDRYAKLLEKREELRRNRESFETGRDEAVNVRESGGGRRPARPMTPAERLVRLENSLDREIENDEEIRETLIAENGSLTVVSSRRGRAKLDRKELARLARRDDINRSAG